MSTDTVQVVNGYVIELTEPVVEADKFPPQQKPPPAPHWLGSVGRWALGAGIPFAAAALTSALIVAWAPSLGIGAALIAVLLLVWVAAVLTGAFLLRRFWALLVVPAAAIAGTFLGIGVAAGFDSSKWPQGAPDGWSAVLMLSVFASLALAAIGLALGKFEALYQSMRRRMPPPMSSAA